MLFVYFLFWLFKVSLVLVCFLTALLWSAFSFWLMLVPERDIFDLCKIRECGSTLPCPFSPLTLLLLFLSLWLLFLRLFKRTVLLCGCVF